ncbi:MAG: hypothetical protein M3M83_02630, partial [Thermoproteota archaeon]|nr:hypothetical protein [Thermoproteota archaeon]
NNLSLSFQLKDSCSPLTEVTEVSTKLVQSISGWRVRKTGEGNTARSKQIKESTRIFVAKVNEV